MDKIVIYKPTKLQNGRYRENQYSMLYCMGFESIDEIKDVIERNELGEVTDVLKDLTLPKDKDKYPYSTHINPSCCAYVMRLDDEYRMLQSVDFSYLDFRRHLDKKFRKTDIISSNFPKISKNDLKPISLHCNYPLYITNFVASPSSITPADLVDQIYQFAKTNGSLTTRDVFISNGGNIPYLREVDRLYREKFSKPPLFYANFGTDHSEYFSVKMSIHNSTIVLNELDRWYGRKLF